MPSFPGSLSGLAAEIIVGEAWDDHWVHPDIVIDLHVAGIADGISITGWNPDTEKELLGNIVRCAIAMGPDTFPSVAAATVPLRLGQTFALRLRLPEPAAPGRPLRLFLTASRAVAAPADRRTRAFHLYRIAAVRNPDQVWGSLSTAYPAAALHRVEKGVLRGWSDVGAGESGPGRVVVSVDGVDLVTARCDRPRSDPVGRQFALRSGFVADLRTGALRGGSYQIDCRDVSSGRRVPGFPTHITLPDATIAPPAIRRRAPLPSAMPAVTVIVPVHNAHDELRECLLALIRNTSVPCKLLLIDDASTDRRIASLLQRASRLPNVTTTSNPRNLGYTATINRGLALAGRDDVVILNSDAQVCEGWLQMMRDTACAEPDIGTVTAVSNNAGAFSLPDLDTDNEKPSHLTWDQWARLLRQNLPHLSIEAPTGNGFCMYIRRGCLDDTGALDAATFARGYGEENDFCMRAAVRGWRHVVDHRVLVYHSRGASFGEERGQLLSAAQEVLRGRYPGYRMLVEAFLASPEVHAIRFAARRLLLRSTEDRTRPRRRTLFVIGSRTGGTPLTNLDLMRALQSDIEPLLLVSDGSTLSLERPVGDGFEMVVRHKLRSPVEPVTHASAEYDGVVGEWLRQHAIEMIHIRHFAWHSWRLPLVARAQGIPTVLSFHDYYAICPTVKLIDGDGRYCGGICGSGSACIPDLWEERDMPPLRDQFVHGWRSTMAAMLSHCAAFVTTSVDVRSLILATFPGIAGRPFEVIPHGRDIRLRPSALARQIVGGAIGDGESIRIAVPGNISVAKGAAIIRTIAELDTEKKFEFHVIGDCVPWLRDFAVCHGRYAREELGGLLDRIDPHVGAIWSIWPETYCHTLTELWAHGVPVIGSPFGAVGERLRRSGAGHVLSGLEPATVMRETLDFVRDPVRLAAAASAVDRWQREEGSYGTSEMARRYAELYASVVRSRRTFAPREPSSVSETAARKIVETA